MAQFPKIVPEVFHTSKGTPFLKQPGVALLAKPDFYKANLHEFIAGFDAEAGFDANEYVEDLAMGVNIGAGDDLAKTAGQLCYMSFGDGRSKMADTKKYLDNIKSSGHGSVLEHVNFTLLFWGLDRSCTHELVRHRAGFGFSQVSQRYVDGKVLRFVERAEFQDDETLHVNFMADIDRAAEAYEWRAGRLMTIMADKLAKMPKRDARKAVNQAARSCLPNETEAPIIVTANARGWRHFLEMRASRFADTPIRTLAMFAHKVLAKVSPLIFDDYVEEQLPDGSFAVETKFRKV